jgi:ribosomal protein S18 acetylase RimI-like enzyme
VKRKVWNVVNDISIRLTTSKEVTNEIRKLASSTGSEEDEINGIVRGDRVFLAKKKGKTLGFISLRVMRENISLEISGLAVEQRERRRGLASLLLKRAEKFARDNKFQKLTVVTGNDNIPALTLYQKRGFKITEVRLGTMIAHHGGKEILGWERIPVRDEIILDKDLSP